ncbi:hypothetical protein NQZ68_041851 [Dissostichus eleginoides]|nr:hypothetical protein NQZ68_041851 [Dissostichus eleginoides]
MQGEGDVTMKLSDITGDFSAKSPGSCDCTRTAGVAGYDLHFKRERERKDEDYSSYNAGAKQRRGEAALSMKECRHTLTET